MALPTGKVHTPAPWGPLGCPWENATRHISSHQRAHAKYPRIPIALGVVMELLESCGDIKAVNANDGTGVPSYGPMQVKTAYWQYLEPSEDVFTADGGIMLGYAVLDHYYGQTGSWQGAVKKYHPGRDPQSGVTPESYVRYAADAMAEFLAASDDAPVPGTGYNWNDPGWAPSVGYGIVTKSRVGAGFDRVPFRGPGMIGTCDHITAGGGDPDFIRRFFSIGGERHNDALTDSVIGRDGSALILNDPWDESNGGTRAGWANGGSNGLEGDGIDFVRKLGVTAINSRLFSKEHICRSGERLTTKQIETSISMSVTAHQRAKTKWDTFPYNDVAGCFTAMTHDEFSLKDGEYGCPGGIFHREHLPVIWQGVKEGLKIIQTGTGGPVSPPEPPPPIDPIELPFDLEWNAVAWMFGTLPRKMADGTIRNYPADPKGIITNAWLARAAKDGVFPRAVMWEAIGEKQFVQFQNGWVLYTPKLDDFINWRWVDIRDLEDERAATGQFDTRWAVA